MSLFSVLFYAYSRVSSVQRWKTELVVRQAKDTVARLVVLDTVYFAGNNTVVIYVYLSEPYVLEIVNAYVDGVLVDPANHLDGFGEPVQPYTAFRIAFTYQLAPGAHTVSLATRWGAVFDATIQA